MSADPTIPDEAPEDAREAFPHGVARAPSAPVHPLHALCLTLAGEALEAHLAYRFGARSATPRDHQLYEAQRFATAVRDVLADAYCSAVTDCGDPSDGPVTVDAISVATLAYLRECLPAASIVTSAREALRRAEQALVMGVASASVAVVDAPAVVAPTIGGAGGGGGTTISGGAPPRPATRIVVLTHPDGRTLSLNVPATDEATYGLRADGERVYIVRTDDARPISLSPSQRVTGSSS